MSRIEAYAYEDGNEIRVNITDENSSILLSFCSEEAYQAFCKEVCNLERMSEKEASS